MRIAYLLESTELCGGVLVAALQAEELARRGHRVVVVTPRPAEQWFRLSLAHLEVSSFGEARGLAEADVRVATFWTTVAPALEGARGPVFHLCQGYEADLSFYDRVRSHIEAAYAMPARKLAITSTLARALVSKGFGPVTEVGQAFDGRPFFPGPERGGAPPVVVVVGPYLGHVKGVDVALEGLRRWREAGGDFRLRRIATLAPEAAERASGLIDEYHHGLDPSQMPFAYRASDLFLGANRREEGFGLPVLEALASGLPCLLSDTPTHREIAGDAAWYFPDGDPDGLAAALPRVATREARARARAEGPAVAARFAPAKVAQRLEKVFEEALRGA